MGKKKSSRSKRSHKNNEIVDERFAAAASRPQFQKPKEHSTKVVLDERFASVLTDPRFRVDEKDKYGRRKKQKQHEQSDAHEELGAFYTIEKEDSPEQNSSDDESATSSSSTEQSENEANESQDPASRIAYLTALSRGELSVSSSSDEDASDSSEDEQDDSDNEDDSAAAAGVLDPSAKEEEEVSLTEEPSPYIAVMNMDWEHVRAVDLFAIISSFTPPGAVRRVQVFPSDFGMERMAKEERYGPSGLWKQDSKEENQENTAAAAIDDDNDREIHQSYDDEDEDDINPNAVDSDFDPEKLRAYEASKLKYYFAVVEFSSPEYADVAYREVDGLELEHSSAAMDLRSISAGDLENVVKGRTLRDEATAVPSNYEPPDFVVSALQQTVVQCTWEEGDAERARKLTGYGKEEWSALAEADDLRAYLASDVSSDEGDDSDGDGGANAKGSKMRKMLGLDSDDGDGSDANDSSDAESENDDEECLAKETTFVPGKSNLEDRIRSKLQSSKEEPKELTPWQKYQEKRKEKKRERRQAARRRRKGISEDTYQGNDGDGMYGSDPEFDASALNDDDDGDDFFLEATGEKKKHIKTGRRKKGGETDNAAERKAPDIKEELELLLAGDNDEEEAKDYDMRGLLRVAKNKDKKLHGSRKRKEAAAAANISGADFKINTKDERFAAVLDGTDDRFGIDRTDPNFIETPGMNEILSVQTKRRKAKKAKTTQEVVPDVSADSGGSFGQTSGGAAALSSLVKSLKSKVAKSGQ